MKYDISFTPKEKYIIQVLFTKNIEIATLPKIATQLSMRYSIKNDTNLYTFLKTLVSMSILKSSNHTNYTKGIVRGQISYNGQNYNVYEVNKKAIAKIYRSSFEYYMIEAIKKYYKENQKEEDEITDLAKDFGF